ncbi:diguanylate cyclase domain-containing protein [Roseibium salinum]|uniref:diguanylate cyclase domain-containing protein n=1 Tax=Roseibium salinum TaxID=1604349 RepID=UPI003621683A
MQPLRSRLAGITIRTKLTVGFGLALVLVLLTGAFSVGQISKLNRFAADITARWLPEMEALGDLRHALAEHRILATGRMQTTNYRQLAAIVDAMRLVNDELAVAAEAYLKVAHTQAERDGLATFMARFDAYRDSLNQAFARLDSGNPSDGQDIFEAETIPLHEHAASQLEELVAASRQEGLNASAEAKRLYNTSLAVMLAVVGAGVALVLVATFWISRRISTPILKISAAMDRLSAGENAVELPEEGDRTDEIGTLVAAAAAYRDSLRRSRLLTAETEAHRVRFAAAIDNMPVGLSMFDAKGALIVSNGRYGAMYGLPPELTEPGTLYRGISSKQVDLGFRTTSGNASGSKEAARSVPGERTVSLIEAADGRTFSVVDQPMTGGGWVSTHEDITDRRRDEARIAHMARHDALTDLPNRAAFKDRLEEALLVAPGNDHSAILCLDLDRFKTVNDTLGHPIGDGLLKLVSRRLLSCIGEADMVSRLGGDEFAIIQVGGKQPDAARALAQQVLDALCEPYVVDGHQLVIGTSIGIAIAPGDGNRGGNPHEKRGHGALPRKKRRKGRVPLSNRRWTLPCSSGANSNSTFAWPSGAVSSSCTISRSLRSPPATSRALRRSCAGSTLREDCSCRANSFRPRKKSA